MGIELTKRQDDVLWAAINIFCSGYCLYTAEHEVGFWRYFWYFAFAVCVIYGAGNVDRALFTRKESNQN
jgi:hypothetical protein